MNSVELRLNDDRTSYTPEEIVEGTVSWGDLRGSKSIEVRLFWYTEGKGTQDVEIIDSVSYEQPEGGGERRFSFRLPDSPYSFSGQLISLLWAVEAVVLPQNHTQRVDIVMSPTGEEVAL